MAGKRAALPGRIGLTILIVAGPPCCLIMLRLGLHGVMSRAGAQMLLLAVFGWVWISLFIAPAALLFDRRPPTEGPEDGGGGGGGTQPDPGPVAPRGGIPLPDATQARARRRDHRSPLHRRAARRVHPTAPRRIRTGPVRRRTHARAASGRG